MESYADDTLTIVDQAIDRAVDYLFSVQRACGEWRDYTASSALGTGTCVLALHYADHERYAEFIEQGCAWLRQTQHADGGWGDAVVDRSNLNATTFALPALKLADPAHSQEAVARGLAFIEAQGGYEALCDMQRASLSLCCLTFMALGGFEGYEWERMPRRLPVEPIFLPRRIWQKISFTMPAVFCLGMVHSRRQRLSPLRRWLTRQAEPLVLNWLRKAVGENGGCQESPLMTSVMYIGLNQAGVGRDIAERLLPFLLETRREDGSWTSQRYLEVSVTTYILEALEAAGLLNDARLKPTIDWLFWQQFDEPFYPTGCPAGAWSWGRPSGWADIDDTSGALTMLLRMGVPSSDSHIRKGFQCLEAMQNRDGSWGMFVKESNTTIDKPCPALTARAALAFYERDHAFSPPLERALAYLRRVQRADGSVYTLWFRDYVYGTALTLDAFATMGLAHDPTAQRCKEWLVANQNDDGSWGASRGVPGTAEETAWALSALLAPGVSAPPACLDRAATWLAEHQRPDGTWEQFVLGVYSPDVWYSDDHIANSFSLRALGRYWRWRMGRSHSASQHSKQSVRLSD
jgi:squalene-hopene/tetraprenyl-beta-curcumene cyclase